ncbi:MAG TPA: hypothetical protein PKE12_05190 [Kiritimatiellia bacterium]|nr:hypothetical protein [Kiritimatiellia bacterium]
MKPRSYPVTSSLWRAARAAAVFLAFMLLLFMAVELSSLAMLLHRLHPHAPRWFLALIAVGLLVATIRILLWRAQAKSLHAPALPPPATATYRDLKTFVQHLILVLKRAAAHPGLPAELARTTRQRAYDLESTLGAHPLLDDLRRDIGRTENETWQRLIEHLDQEAIAFARYKMHAVVRDAIEPPFPVVHPALTMYHQFTLVSCIVDCYVTRPSLIEYATVLRDVWRVMSGGEYFRIGQRLFEGIYRNSPPLGPAAEDLGQALSVIWLTWNTAQAAMHRCRHFGAWTVDGAIKHLDSLTIDSLLVTRDTLIRDVLPLIKLRLRHSVGPAVADAAGFTEGVMDGIVKAVDGVIQGFRAQGPLEAVEHSRRSLHGLYREPDARPRREGRNTD